MNIGGVFLVGLRLVGGILVLLLVACGDAPDKTAQEKTKAKEKESASSGKGEIDQTTLPAEKRAAVVIIEGDAGAGTGFIAKIKGKLYVVTNQHVLARSKKITMKDTKGRTYDQVRTMAGKEADIALIELASPPSDVPFLEFANNPERVAQPGDPVVVPGNRLGDGVITMTPGKLTAFDPQRLEVDVPVFQGNSGSPIYHPKSGKVIGVLTEAEKVNFDEFTEEAFRDGRATIKSEIRYFGHRVDAAKGWRKIDWKEFRSISDAVAESRANLDAVIAFYEGTDDYAKCRELVDALARVNTALAAERLSDAGRVSAVEGFARSLRAVCSRKGRELATMNLYFTHREEVKNLRAIAKRLELGADFLDENADVWRSR